MKNSDALDLFDLTTYTQPAHPAPALTLEALEKMHAKLQRIADEPPAPPLWLLHPLWARREGFELRDDGMGGAMFVDLRRVNAFEPESKRPAIFLPMVDDGTPDGRRMTIREAREIAAALDGDT